ncbi:hypothetical protein [Microbacterium sp. bgisy189]|uniref:hypothetical protein n=1 Tax=Microbacterium sp. bgisy189 TaxID=3413798 RepID=UPI003EBF9D03
MDDFQAGGGSDAFDSSTNADETTPDSLCWRVDSGRIEEQLDDCDAAPEDPDEDEPAEDTVETFSVTITDLVSFAPRGVTTIVEPDGLGLIGMPVNFVAPADVHTATGQLFGFDIAARFTPVEFVFVYGDGTSQTTSASGQSWNALGQAQLTATDTSHAYAERGTYTAHTVIRYSAEVDLGAGWIPVPGTLDIPTADVDIQIFEAHTALVEHTCEEDPTGPGC